jgi:Leucine-rich repeat (LRR) protein
MSLLSLRQPTTAHALPSLAERSNGPNQSRTVRIYKNGDPFFSGKLLLLPKHGDLNSILDLVAATLAGGRPVLKLFDADTGTEVDELDKLVDGSDLVAGMSRGKFKPLAYREILNDHARDMQNSSPKPPLVLPKPSAYKAPKPAKSKLLSTGRKSPRERNPQALPALPIDEKPRVVTLVRNGDASVVEVTFLITKRNAADWDHLCQEISDKLQMGVAVRKIYTQNGVEVVRAADMLDGGVYVAAEKGYRPLANGYEAVDLHSLVASSTSPGGGRRQRVHIKGAGDLSHLRASLPAIGRAMDEAKRTIATFDVLTAADKRLIQEQTEQLEALAAQMEAAAEGSASREAAQTALLAEMLEQLTKLKAELMEARGKLSVAEASELALRTGLEAAEDRNGQLLLEKQTEEKVAKRALQAKEDQEAVADRLSIAASVARQRLRGAQEELRAANAGIASELKQKEGVAEQLEKAQRGWVKEMASSTKAREAEAQVSAELHKLKRATARTAVAVAVAVAAQQTNGRSAESQATLKRALRRFYDANHQLEHVADRRWFTAVAPDVAEWAGLSTDSATGEVVALKLDGFRLGDSLQVDGLAELHTLCELDLGDCAELTRLPVALAGLAGLKVLKLGGCKALAELPSGLGELTKLTTLDARFCTQLRSLPPQIGRLSQLVRLNLAGCGALRALPSELGDCLALEELDLSSCAGLAVLPARIGELAALTQLSLCGCTQLQTVPDQLGSLSSLRELDVGQCTGVRALPAAVGQLSELTSLTLSGCTMLLELPPELGDLAKLVELNIHRCTSLRMLPPEILQLGGLRKIDVGGCEPLVDASSSLWDLCWLTSLDASECHQMTAVPAAVRQLVDLEEFSLCECTSLVGLPTELRQLTKLIRLDLARCSKLTELPSLAHLLPGLQVETHGAAPAAKQWVARGCKPA